MTLVELIVAFTILSLLTTMAVPLARYKVRRDKERDLNYALRDNPQGHRRLQGRGAGQQDPDQAWDGWISGERWRIW